MDRSKGGRSKLAFDPGILDAAGYGPAYNAGIDGANLTDVRLMLEHAERFDKRLRLAVIELYLPRFYIGENINSSRQPLISVSSLASYPARFLFSTDAIEAAIETWRAARRGQRIPFSVRLDGMLGRGNDLPLADADTWAAPHLEDWRRGKIIPILDDAVFSELATISSICAPIQCVFVLSPLSKVETDALQAAGRLSVIQDWKSRTSSIVSAFDYVNELEGQPQNWTGYNHFSVAAGSRILESVIKSMGAVDR